MSTITVGAGEQYSTISAAVAASSSGDTIDVNAGTYTNDFINISHNITLAAVGGSVNLIATTEPPNGKGIIDEGGSGVTVAITGFDISGASVADGNGAGVRYEGGVLTLSDDTVHGNQEGLLANADPAGAITISNSTFESNGIGDGLTHNIYVNDIAQLTVENSTVTAADVGHDIKSRAATTTITGDTITDGASGTASYEIDIPNGGVAEIDDNVIQKGANAQNPAVISYGEEGNVYANSSLTVAGNTILNDDPSRSATAVLNDTGVTATLSDNSFYGLPNITSGLAAITSSTILATEPALSSLTASGVTQASTTPAATATTSAVAPTTTPSTAATPASTPVPTTTPTATTPTATTPTVATVADTTATATTPTDPALPATDPTPIAAASPASTDVTTTESDGGDTVAITGDTVGASVTPTDFLSSTTASDTGQTAALAPTTDVQTPATILGDQYTVTFVPKGTPYPLASNYGDATVYAPAALNQHVNSGVTPFSSVYPS